ncbi:hypothetical protein TNCT_593351, partial [Trichonephila clavata]
LRASGSIQDAREEEDEVEPVVTYDCDYCDYRSPTQKGLRCHRITVHRIGVGSYQSLPGHHQVYLQRCTAVAVWTTGLVTSVTAFTPSSGLSATPQGCLVKSLITSVMLPGHHQVYLQRCSLAVWSTSLITSVIAWIPSRALRALHFSGCLVHKFNHISHCLDTIKGT